MTYRWLPIGIAMTAIATGSTVARADTPAAVAAAETPPGTDTASTAKPLACRLEIVVPVESDVDGLEIERDGVLVPASSYGVAVPVDAGTHVLTARGPGRVPWSTHIRLAPGGTTVTLTIPRLNAEPAVQPTSHNGVQATAPAADGIEGGSGKAQQTMGFVLAGTGLAAISAGAWLGFSAAAEERELRAQCPWSYCMNTEARDRLRSQAAVANTFVFLGLASSVGAAVLFLTMPSATAAERRAAAFNLAPAVAPGGGASSLPASSDESAEAVARGQKKDRDPVFFEPPSRLELETYGLRNRCSTTELRWRTFLYATLFSSVPVGATSAFWAIHRTIGGGLRRAQITARPGRQVKLDFIHGGLEGGEQGRRGARVVLAARRRLRVAEQPINVLPGHAVRFEPRREQWRNVPAYRCPRPCTARVARRP